MNQALTDFLVACGPLALLTMGFVELVKRQGLPSRLAPLASVACGVVMMALVRLSGFTDWIVWEVVLAGLVTAMIASGTYSGVKAVTGNS